MTPSGISYISIQLELEKKISQKLTRLIDEQSILPGLSGYFEVLFDASNIAKDSTKIMLYFPPDENLASLHLEILLAAMGCLNYKMQTEQINKTDYLEAYKKHYTSFDISENITIVPSWEKENFKPARENQILLNLDPGLAFGTGKHPTSLLCLQFLDRNRPIDKTIIDAGCGSGILSIGSLLLGAKKVIAFDIDSNAIHASRQNLKLNQESIDGVLELFQCGFDDETIGMQKADIMIANLTANVLLVNQKYIDQISVPEILLSGIIVEQADQVEEAYRSGWQLEYKEEKEGWILLYMKQR